MWQYNQTTNFTPPEDAIGYIYLITCIDESRQDLFGKIYVGRKMLSSNRKVRLTKKEKLLPENKRKTFKRVIKSTGWENYWGSSEDLLADVKLLGEDKFKREILLFTTDKTSTSFYEMYFQIKYDVLFKPSYNKHIANTKFFKGKIAKLTIC